MKTATNKNANFKVTSYRTARTSIELTLEEAAAVTVAFMNRLASDPDLLKELLELKEPRCP